MFKVNLVQKMTKGYGNPFLLHLLALRAQYEKQYSGEMAVYNSEIQRIGEINNKNETAYRQALRDAENSAYKKEDEDFLKKAGFNTVAITERAKASIQKPTLEIVQLVQPVKQTLTNEQQQLFNLYQEFEGKNVCFVPEKRIEKICKNYDLVFAPLQYFCGTVDGKVGDAIRTVCREYNLDVETAEFMLVAPRKMFDFSPCVKKIEKGMTQKLEEVKTRALVQEAEARRKKDPLLFIKYRGFYVPVWKWGSDISVFRRIRGFFKSYSEWGEDYYSQPSFNLVCIPMAFVWLLSICFMFLPVLLALSISIYIASETVDYGITDWITTIIIGLAIGLIVEIFWFLMIFVEEHSGEIMGIPTVKIFTDFNRYYRKCEREYISVHPRYNSKNNEQKKEFEKHFDFCHCRRYHLEPIIVHSDIHGHLGRPSRFNKCIDV